MAASAAGTHSGKAHCGDAALSWLSQASCVPEDLRAFILSRESSARPRPPPQLWIVPPGAGLPITYCCGWPCVLQLAVADDPAFRQRVLASKGPAADRTGDDPPAHCESCTANVVIRDFSQLTARRCLSEEFAIAGRCWRLLLFPKGNSCDFLSLYLDVVKGADEQADDGWQRPARLVLTISSALDPTQSVTKGASL